MPGDHTIEESNAGDRVEPGHDELYVLLSGRLHLCLSEFGISNASAQCIGYQEAVDMVTLGEVYKSSQLVIVSLRVCSKHDPFIELATKRKFQQEVPHPLFSRRKRPLYKHSDNPS